MTTKPKPTAGEQVLIDLAWELEKKAVRLRNKAALVRGDQGKAGRNLTALRTTIAEMRELLAWFVAADLKGDA